MSEVIIRTLPLGGGPLTRAAVAGHLPEWYPAIPADPEGWRRRLEKVRASIRPDWLESLAPAFAASGAERRAEFAGARAGERLARVSGGAGVVVTTGQQPGLFGGPIYTWSKALSALALADVLEEVCGIPVAPVFWAATDDADIAEASSTWVALREGATLLRMGIVEDRGLPMSEVPLPDVGSQLAALRRASGSVANPRPLELVEGAYSGRRTVGGAYLELLRSILEPLGIAVLDASHAAVRTAAAPVLRHALAHAPELDERVRHRTREIGEAGFEPQVTLVDGLSPVFLYESGGRRRIPIADAPAFRDHDSAVLGPNVLLRPVVERSLMPTAAYVAGPGEFAYFAQVSAISDALELPGPLPVPRWSTLLLEPDVNELLARHGITPSDLDDDHAAERELAARLLPAAVTGPIGELRRALGTQMGRLDAALDGEQGALVPPGVPSGAARAIEHRIDRLERRYRAAVRRREERAFTELARMRASLRPGGAPQERALNFIPFLARYGWSIMDDMTAAAREHALHLAGVPAGAVPRDGGSMTRGEQPAGAG